MSGPSSDYAAQPLPGMPLLEAPPQGHLHALFAQCPLPYRDPRTAAWSMTNGRHSIVVAGGYVAGGRGKTVGLGVPYGSRARLVLAHLQTYAVRHQTPVIPIGRSFTAFIKTFGCRVSGGARGTIAQFREQTLRLAAANWTFATVDATQQVATNRFDHLVGGIDLFYRPDTGDLRLTEWPRELNLTPTFFEHLRRHAMPINIGAYTQLSDNARAMDIYVWLAHRLRRIAPRRPLVLTIAQFAELFAAGVAAGTSTSTNMLIALDRALAAYPRANVSRERVRIGKSYVWHITLSHSPAPIDGAS